MARITVVVVVLALAGAVFAHDVMTVPTPLGRPESTVTYCGSGQGATVGAPVAAVQAGRQLNVTWKGAHADDATVASVNLHLIPTTAGSTARFTQQTMNAGLFASNVNYRVYSQLFTIPAGTAAGTYLLHWGWGTYHSCAVIAITAAAAPPANTGSSSNAVGGGGNSKTIANGQVDPLTGAITCNSGYMVSGDRCALNGGAVFGIFLAVLIVVGVVGFVGVMAYFRSNRPELYNRIKTKLHLDGRSGSAAPPKHATPAPAPVQAAPPAVPTKDGRALPPLPPGAPPVPANRPLPALPPRNPMYNGSAV